MLRRILFLITLLIFLSINSWAYHVKGGWIKYEHLSSDLTAKTSNYKITITVYFGYGIQGPRTSVNLDIYDAKTFSHFSSTTINTTTSDTIFKTYFSPCMSNAPSGLIVYEVYTYVTTVTLPDNTNGYFFGVTDYRRTSDIINITNSDQEGIAITATMPGTSYKNSSPEFIFNDTAIVCHNLNFTYQFNAIDTIDNDSLSYSFGNGLNGYVVTTPPYASVSYASGFSGINPFGTNVSINPVTGLISGIAPATAGIYDLSVYVKEWRNGTLMDSVKKELQIYVYDCSLLSAELKKTYINCDSLTLSFQNLSTASNITQYIWSFGDTLSKNNTNDSAVVTHTYTTAGVYTLSLYVANNEGCNNSTTATVKVYPGFTPNIKVTGSCYQSPIQYADATIAKYGVVNSWLWDFGDPTSSDNSATTDTASHLYSKAETVPVILQVGSSVGCSGSDTVQVVINDKPNITLPFTDTLICSNDTLPLRAYLESNNLSYSWSPTYNMINLETLNPKVFPQDTTTYTLTVHQNGCIGAASIKVNVLQFITVSFNPDTMHVCLSDSIKLSPISYALSYLWTESDNRTTLDSNSVKYPKASPKGAVTTYFVKANLGHCYDSSFVKVYASPYPKATIINPAADTTICYGDSINLFATKVGAFAQWSPTMSLSDSTILTPIAKPTSNTTYSLSVSDTFYCPKPVVDSVAVNVIPQFFVTAGDDTTAVLSEPLQLFASLTDTSFQYPVTYKWSPTNFFDNPNLQNPTLTATSAGIDSILITATTTEHHCVGTGNVVVRFFTTKPDIFVPTAFVPNGSYPDNILTPTPVGIAHFEYFKVFNRWGQELFSTNATNKGWDGTFNGVIQNSGTYVYIAQGIDYQHHVVTKKGTVVLIR